MIDNYFIRNIALPITVEGVTIVNSDGTYDIYINSLLSEPKQKAALEHELNHIQYNHLYSLTPIETAELEAEQKNKATVIPQLRIKVN